MTELSENKAREDRLKSALERVESNADQPCIPGEAALWLEEVEAALTELKPALDDQVEHGHRAAFRQIREEDPEMFRRIEQMQADDLAITEQYADVCRRMELLRSVTHRVDQDEKRVEGALEEFVPLVQALVAQIRKQEVTVRAWLMEAFNRDRGDVD
jgi:hypothetical protein